MRTREPEPGLGAAASQIVAHAKSIARLEARLAAAELKDKIGSLGKGIGLGVGAAVLALFSIALALGTIVAALATAMAVWLAFLIVTAACLAMTAILGMLAVRAIRAGTPPVPRQAIEDVKLTAEALKNGNGRGAYS